MSDKDLQRVTASVFDIGRGAFRRSINARRKQITHKVRIAGKRTLYLISIGPSTMAFLENLCDLLSRAQFKPCGPVVEDGEWYDTEQSAALARDFSPILRPVTGNTRES